MGLAGKQAAKGNGGKSSHFEGRLPRPAVFGPVVVTLRFLGQVMAFAQGAGMSSSKKNPPVREDSMMKVKSAQELDQAATLMR